MNEGRQITKEQAEACMRADAEFVTAGWLLLYRVSDGQIIANDKTNDFNGDGWIEASSWNHERAYTIHADPNNTAAPLFGTERELTFEEVGAALFRWGTVKVIFPNKNDALIKLVTDRGQLEIHESDDGGKTWCVGFLPDGLWRYTLYKEPTPPEPLTLEAIEALVKALEDRS